MDCRGPRGPRNDAAGETRVIKSAPFVLTAYTNSGSIYGYNSSSFGWASLPKVAMW